MQQEEADAVAALLAAASGHDVAMADGEPNGAAEAAEAPAGARGGPAARAGPAGGRGGSAGALKSPGVCL